MLNKQAGKRITNARKIFGNLCRGGKETSRRGGSIGRTMEEHIEGLGLDMGKEEDINTLCSTVGKAHQKGSKAFGDLMLAWEDWERLATKIGRNSEVTDKNIEALAALHAWGHGNRQENK